MAMPDAIVNARHFGTLRLHLRDARKPSAGPDKAEVALRPVWRNEGENQLGDD